MLDPINFFLVFGSLILVTGYVIFTFAYTIATIKVYGWDFQNEDILDAVFLIPYRILIVTFKKKSIPVRWNRCER